MTSRVSVVVVSVLRKLVENTSSFELVDRLTSRRGGWWLVVACIFSLGVRLSTHISPVFGVGKSYYTTREPLDLLFILGIYPLAIDLTVSLTCQRCSSLVCTQFSSATVSDRQPTADRHTGKSGELSGGTASTIY
jgi:hypothetical protein